MVGNVLTLQVSNNTKGGHLATILGSPHPHTPVGVVNELLMHPIIKEVIQHESSNDRERY